MQGIIIFLNFVGYVVLGKTVIDLSRKEKKSFPEIAGILFYCLVILFSLIYLISESYSYWTMPYKIGEPDNKIINSKGSVSYIIECKNEEDAALFSKEDIVLIGFEADLDIVKIKGNRILVRLNNIEGDNGEKRIAVDISRYKKYAQIMQSNNFKIGYPENSYDLISISITNPANDYVYENGSIMYILHYASDSKNFKINLSKEDILLYNFSADIEIEEIDNRTRLIQLKNIKDTYIEDRDKYIGIRPFSAEANSTLSFGIPRSEKFTILKDENVEKKELMPLVQLSSPSKKIIKRGDSISYSVVAFNVNDFSLESSDISVITQDELKYDLEISNGVRKNEKIITLKNISGKSGILSHIRIAPGVVSNNLGKSNEEIDNTGFRIIQR